MKKSLLALAALGAFSGLASAQSSVTLFGIVDATLAFGHGSVSNKTQLTNSGFNSSRLGFRGIEDMGGGLQAGFWLEAGLTNDDGTAAGSNSNNQASGAGAAVAGRQGLTFNRRSTVSVGGGWGELRLGRDYTPHFWNQTVYDPFGTNGVGTTQTLNSSIGGPTTVRASNSITYLYGHAFNNTYAAGNAGFHFAAQYYLGENASGAATSKDGTGFSFRAGYNAGPLSVAFANGNTKYATGKITTTNLAGSYDMGVIQPMFIWDRDKVAGGNKGSGWLIGALMPLGQAQLRMAYSTYTITVPNTATTVTPDPKTTKWAFGYVYNLSRRTALYTTWARTSNSAGAAQALNGAATAANNNSTGLDFGLRHAF